MVHVEFNEINNIYIYNVTTFLSHKINRKMTMPSKLIWIDENFL